MKKTKLLYQKTLPLFSLNLLVLLALSSLTFNAALAEGEMNSTPTETEKTKPKNNSADASDKQPATNNQQGSSEKVNPSQPPQSTETEADIDNDSVGPSGSQGAGWSRGINIINQEPGLSKASAKQVLKNTLKWLSGLLAFSFMLSLIASGLIMMLSVGTEEGFRTAKKWATFSLIGLIIALSAFIIISTIGKIILGG